MLAKIFTGLCLCVTAILSAQCPVETPSGPIFTKENPQLDFNYLKTYAKPPDEKGSLPVETFDQATTTFVYAKMEVQNLLQGVRDQEYALTYKYILEDGTNLGEFTLDFTIQKDWETAWYKGKAGWDKPGHWPTGTHRVEVWINGEKFAVRTFKVTVEKE